MKTNAVLSVFIISLTFLMISCNESKDEKSAKVQEIKQEAKQEAKQENKLIEVTDAEIGLRKNTVEDESLIPVDFTYVGKEAGESEFLVRAFYNAPPQISHSLEDMLPITPDNNTCISCHDLGADAGDEAEREVGMPTPIPRSHYYDLRNNKPLEALSQTRFNCMQCHVPQADLQPLVKNTFQGDFADEKSKTRSNFMDILNSDIN